MVADGHALLSDSTRSSLGIPRGGVWFSTGAACLGLSADVLLIPLGKSDAIWREVELRGPAVKDGRIVTKLPAVVLSGNTSSLLAKRGMGRLGWITLGGSQPDTPQCTLGTISVRQVYVPRVGEFLGCRFGAHSLPMRTVQG